MKVNLYKIQRFCINDGPGIRTTVFFKGCPLRCKWCHNPETQHSRPELMFNDSLCTNCGRCVPVCPNDVHELVDGRHVVHFDRCRACGGCVKRCLPNALTLCGEQMSVGDIMDLVMKDIDYYAESGGGVTVSGGEPLAQPAPLKALIEACRERNLTVYIDTSGFADPTLFGEVAASVDGILYDLKGMDMHTHARYVGVDNDLILENFRHACGSDVELRIRFVVVPGITDSQEELDAVARFAKDCGFTGGIDLLPYHRFGNSKHAHLGLRYELGAVDPPSAGQLEKIRAFFEAEGFPTHVG